MDNTTQPLPVITGIADTRATPLGQLAATGADEAAVRRAVPALKKTENVVVCAFASSI